MNHYGYTGLEFEWGFHLMFVLGIVYEYKQVTIALGPLFLEWRW